MKNEDGKQLENHAQRKRAEEITLLKSKNKFLLHLHLIENRSSLAWN